MANRFLLLQVKGKVSDPGNGDPYASYLVYDSFTDIDNVALLDHTPEKGGPWVAQAGSSVNNKISGNKALFQDGTAGDGSKYVIQTDEADVVIAGEITLAGNNGFVWARVADASGTGIILHFDVALDGLKIWEFTDPGGYNNIAAVAQSYSPGDVVLFEATLLGTSITFKDLTNAKTASATTTFGQTNTRHGIGEQLGPGTKFDDFTIT